MPGHPLIGFEETMAGHRASIWLNSVSRGAAYSARAASVLGLTSGR
jgi:hypothetical protein